MKKLELVVRILEANLANPQYFKYADEVYGVAQKSENIISDALILANELSKHFLIDDDEEIIG